MSPDNAAAWLNTRPGRLEVGPAPYPTPGPHQMAVRNAAVAVNPAALAEGRFRAAPEPKVIGHGLESIQTALDAQRAGVSAQKLVVMLGEGPARQ
jgi:NADPH:quinone reductase-like Zn-dependent oxidoreductase